MLEQTLGTQAGATLSAPRGTVSRDVASVGHSLSVPTMAFRGTSYVRPKRLNASEIRRRLLHITPGLLPILLWAIPHPKPWGPILTNVFLFVTVAFVGTSLFRFRAFARPGEIDGKASILGYAFPILAALVLFRGREEIGMMTLALLAFGDGSATLGGITLGGWRLPWNRRKTWTGLLCFIAVGAPAATIVFWGEAGFHTSFVVAAWCGGLATLTAAIAESVPSRINDNLRVGVTAVVVSATVQSFLLGYF